MEKLKAFSRAVFLGARRVLVPAFLFCAYFLALGPLALITRLFGLLPAGEPGPSGFWRLPDGGESGPGAAEGQS